MATLWCHVAQDCPQTLSIHIVLTRNREYLIYCSVQIVSKSVHMELPHCPVILLSASWCSSCALLSMIQTSLLHGSCLDHCPSPTSQIHLCCPPCSPTQHFCRHEGALPVGCDLSCPLLPSAWWPVSSGPWCIGNGRCDLFAGIVECPRDMYPACSWSCTWIVPIVRILGAGFARIDPDAPIPSEFLCDGNSSHQLSAWIGRAWCVRTAISSLTTNCIPGISAPHCSQWPLSSDCCAPTQSAYSCKEGAPEWLVPSSHVGSYLSSSPHCGVPDCGVQSWLPWPLSDHMPWCDPYSGDRPTIVLLPHLSEAGSIVPIHSVHGCHPGASQLSHCHSQESCIPALSLPWTSSSCHCPGHRSKPFPSCPQAKGLSLGCAGHCRSHLGAPIVRLYFQSEATSDWHSPEQRSSLCFWPCRTRLSADCEETRLRWRKHCFLLVDKMSTSMQFYSKQKFKHIALDCLTPTLSDSTFMQQEIKRWCL